MNHPTKAQVQVVIDNLLKAAALAEDNCPVDMKNIHVHSDHPCGSPMCHGGWYAIAMESPGEWVDYSDGAWHMGIHLGFLGAYGLTRWASEYPTIWGNPDGDLMFSSNSAFLPARVTSLHQIIDHWRGVQSRLPE